MFIIAKVPLELRKHIFDILPFRKTETENVTMTSHERCLLDNLKEKNQVSLR